MKVTEELSVVGSSDYIDTEDFCIYAAKNPFWADCKTNEIISKIEGRNAIAVNLVDADSPRYFHAKIFKLLVREIFDKIGEGQCVTVICNKGQSRSASIALLYLAAAGEISKESYNKAYKDFKLLYPDYKPSRGISSFLNNAWGVFFHKNK